jgi:hypothetical protein
VTDQAGDDGVDRSRSGQGADSNRHICAMDFLSVSSFQYWEFWDENGTARVVPCAVGRAWSRGQRQLQFLETASGLDQAQPQIKGKLHQKHRLVAECVS